MSRKKHFLHERNDDPVLRRRALIQFRNTMMEELRKFDYLPALSTRDQRRRIVVAIMLSRIFDSSHGTFIPTLAREMCDMVVGGHFQGDPLCNKAECRCLRHPKHQVQMEIGKPGISLSYPATEADFQILRELAPQRSLFYRGHIINRSARFYRAEHPETGRWCKTRATPEAACKDIDRALEHKMIFGEDGP